jgi:arabinogalactan oligomer/maltooligosaccharide transport system substrate-binding protein
MSNRFKVAAMAASLAMVAGAAAPAAAQTDLTLWTAEGEAEGAFQYVEGLAAAYSEANPDVTITVVNKQVETLREDFLTSSLAGGAPEILWTVADHIGPFEASGTIAPLDGLIDSSVYLPNALEAVTVDGTLWGAPANFGNHLMLYWNKDMLPEGPVNSDELIAMAQANTDAANGKFGLVFNQTESFWLVPFLGGFGGSVFAEDGVTPTLDTEAMVGALQFMHDLKYANGVMPAEADYNVADGLFAQGDAAMIVNGDWALGTYSETFGESLGLGPIPEIVGGEWPRPYTAGKFLMASADAAADEETAAVVGDFIQFATNTENQLAMVEQLRRLPGNEVAINDPLVTEDVLLAGSALAVQQGTAQPTNLEMRCVFDSMTAGVRDLFSSEGADPAAIAASMQSSADAGVAPGGECGPE